MVDRNDTQTLNQLVYDLEQATQQTVTILEPAEEAEESQELI